MSYCVEHHIRLEDIHGIDASHLCHNSLCVTASHITLESHVFNVVKSDIGMQVLQCRYCNTSGSLTPLPCTVVNHCLVVQVLVRTEG